MLAFFYFLLKYTQELQYCDESVPATPAHTELPSPQRNPEQIRGKAIGFWCPGIWRLLGDKAISFWELVMACTSMPQHVYFKSDELEFAKVLLE